MLSLALVKILLHAAVDIFYTASWNARNAWRRAEDSGLYDLTFSLHREDSYTEIRVQANVS